MFHFLYVYPISLSIHGEVISLIITGKSKINKRISNEYRKKHQNIYHDYLSTSPEGTMEYCWQANEDRPKVIKAIITKSNIAIRSRLISRWKEAKTVTVQVTRYSVAIWQTLNDFGHWCREVVVGLFSKRLHSKYLVLGGHISQRS